MDLSAVREQAIEATARAFWERDGTVPDQDSDEWEEEYRRQFEIVKTRLAASPAAAAGAAAAAPVEEAALAELTGQPTQLRWAAQIRTDRLQEIRDRDIRKWLATTWLKAKSWLDTRDLATPVFLQRIAPHYAEYRRTAEERERAEKAKREAREAAAAALRREIEAAHITADGLAEMIDAAERMPPAPIREKLVEIEVEGRNLRVFESGDELTLMVLEKSPGGRGEYGIERDEGLVADLKLYARALELS
ncbi:MAG TPA: hypothetical protein VGR91_03525 [Stellaceae bacterium]|nr:hypothetical protein [Stellaceae bacterium]